MRSDWIPWLSAQSWFRDDLLFSDNYPKAVEHILRPRANRKEFFKRILHPGVPPSSGYISLAHLLARKVVKTILTTNFDQLLADASKSIPEVHAVEEIKTKDDYKIFSTNPKYPQIVYVHGSVEHYTDKNIEKETEELDNSLVELLRPLLRDHPLVVVGYRGGEPSVMKHLLINQRDFCQNFRHGVYWCRIKARHEDEMPILLTEFSRAIGSNFQFVEIDGFDELMGTLEGALPDLVQTVSGGYETTSKLDHRIHDLAPANCQFGELNDVLLSSKLLAYAEAVRLPRPDLSSLTRIAESSAERGLAVFRGEKWMPTNSGLLLFAKSKSAQFAQAAIEVRVCGDPGWVAEVLDRPSNVNVESRPEIEEIIILGGDLWAQLDQALELLARVNKPFRLKGASSKDVYRYPPLALKELLTNMLAHREYEVEERSVMYVTATEICFKNPGGLVEHVKKQLNDQEIQNMVNVYGGGIKGYRNPVIADFFFAAGAMDKKGSGLLDVINEASNNLNEVKFGPTSDNGFFVAAITCRPEAKDLDSRTKTARPSIAGELRYSPNLLSLLRWPDFVWKIGTLSDPKDFKLNELANAPPFTVFKNWIWTFTCPDELHDTTLQRHVYEEEMHRVPISELFEVAGEGGILPRLLNMALENHLVRLGLKIKQEQGRIRAYFPSKDGGAHQVKYMGRFRQATRTVAKPIISRSTGKEIYWEHKAVSLKFENFGGRWFISLVPSYVFTVDGDLSPIASERIGPLSTRRASRDYNQTVLHDLFFWARVLCDGIEPTFRLPVAKGVGVGDRNNSSFAIEVESRLPTVAFQEQVDANMAAEIEGEENISEEEQFSLQEAIEGIIEESAEEEGDDGS